MAQTLFDKIWNEHTVCGGEGFPDTVYIDLHFINQVNSTRAFESLRKRGIPVFRPDLTLVSAEKDYTAHRDLTVLERFKLDLIQKNCSDFGINSNSNFRLPQGKLTGLPGQTIACDYPYTDNLGAFGLLALEINEAQVEQVLATQCLLQLKPKRMKIEVNGKLRSGLRAKDINHYLIAEITAQGASGYFVEFAGDTILSLDMDGRINVCNISREIGALGGIIAPDELTFDYLRDIGAIPETEPFETFHEAWKDLYSDETSVFDEVLEFDAEDIKSGNYSIEISKLINTALAREKSPKAYEGADILEGYNDTDYILNQLDAIEEFEKLKANKNLMV